MTSNSFKRFAIQALMQMTNMDERSVKVFFLNGTIWEGFVRSSSWTDTDATVDFVRHVALRHESPDVRLIPHDILKIELRTRGQEPQTFD